MKKLLAVLSCLAMCLSFAACGEKDESSAEKTESKATVESSDAQTEVSSAAASEDMTIDEFIKENKDTFETLKDALNGTGMEMDILARGNSLVYSYKFTTDTATDKATLDQGLETQKETFVQVLKSLQTVVPSAESVVVEYLDKDGNVISSGEFK